MSKQKDARRNILATKDGGIRDGNKGIRPGPVTLTVYPAHNKVVGDPFAPKAPRIYGSK